MHIDSTDRIEKRILLHAPRARVWRALADAPEGTLLTVVESGFDGIPLARRLEAYRGNDNGWATQMKAIEKYVSQPA